MIAKEKLVIGGLPMLVIVVYTFILNYRGCTNKRQFYENSFKTSVMSSNTFHERSREFHLANGLRMYFSLSDDSTIKIGDSIEKEANTNFYSVYRRNDSGNYQYLATHEKKSR